LILANVILLIRSLFKCKWQR